VSCDSRSKKKKEAGENESAGGEMSSNRKAAEPGVAARLRVCIPALACSLYDIIFHVYYINIESRILSIIASEGPKGSMSDSSKMTYMIG
jgi:hypothetical protein